jgi:ATP-dependent Lon protease
VQVERKIRNRVKRQMEKTQREYYLNEQMKAIQRELGEGDDGREDIAELEDRIKKTKLSKEALAKAEAEIKKLRQMSPMSAESTVVRNYLDWMLSLPWGKKSKVKKDLRLAQEILDADHFGLDKVTDLPGLEELRAAGLLEGKIPQSFMVPSPSDSLSMDEDPLEAGDEGESFEPEAGDPQG